MSSLIKLVDFDNKFLNPDFSYLPPIFELMFLLEC